METIRPLLIGSSRPRGRDGASLDAFARARRLSAIGFISRA